MKILRAYIENFGKLSKQEFNFVNGVNSIIEENGFGKTTLATFIKAMLYGMKSTTKKSLDENEKKKYMPWQGGNYGGYLEFEVNGNLYRVERFFGKKDSDDVFMLTNLKTGKQSKDYSDNLGEELFGIDEDSYERCTFIPQKEIDSNISDKLSAKLINIVQGTSNKDSFETAIKIVKEKSQELKKRGNSGKIAEVETEIAEISEKIDSLKSGSDSLSVFYEKLNEEDEAILNLEKRKEDVSLKVKKYAEAQTLIANKKYIEEKQASKKDLEKTIKENEKLLNGKNISHEEIEELKQRNTEIIKQEAELEILEQGGVVLNRHKELGLFIKNSKIKPEDVDVFIQKEQKINELTAKIEYEKNKVSESFNKNSNKKYLILLPCFVLLFAVLGVVFIKNVLGVVMLSLAGVSLLASVVLFYKKGQESKSNSGKKQKIFSATFNEWVKEKQILSQEVGSFLENYKDLEILNKLSFLYDLKAKITEFNQLEQEIALKKQRIRKVKEVLDSLKSQLDEFFNQFNLKKELSVNEKFLALSNAVRKLNDSKIELKEIDSKLQMFSSQDVDGLNVEEKDIYALQEEEKAIQREIDLHRDKKLSLNQRIYEIKNVINELDELENNLEEKMSERAMLKAEYKTLSLVSDYLTLANDNLTAKYKKPMQDNLNKYLKLVLGNKYHDFDIDTDLKVSFKEFGQSREVDYLSQGFKGVVNLCVRFALIDSLFEKEKPFVVLDDPFVNFDKSKIKNALGVLNELAKEFQIIYFACHESRI